MVSRANTTSGSPRRPRIGLPWRLRRQRGDSSTHRREPAVELRNRNSRRTSLLPQNDLTGTDPLIVQPEPVAKRSGLCAGTGRSAQQTHPAGSLNDIRGKGSTIGDELDLQLTYSSDQ